jgi:hypothetical protein
MGFLFGMVNIYHIGYAQSTGRLRFAGFPEVDSAPLIGGADMALTVYTSKDN